MRHEFNAANVADSYPVDVGAGSNMKVVAVHCR